MTPETKLMQPFLYSRLQDDRGIAAVIFDWDDTIVDSYRYCKALNQKTIQHMNRSGAPHRNIADFPMPDRHLLPQFITLYDPKHAMQATEFRGTLYELTRNDIPLLDHAHETLRLLKRHHIPFAIASNTKEGIVREQFEALFGDEFPEAVIVGSGGHHNHPKKPDPAMIKTALKQLHAQHPLKQGAIYFVGDTHYTDIDASLKLQLSPVLFSPLDTAELMDRANHHLDAELDDRKRYDALLPLGVEYAENHEALQTLFNRKLQQAKHTQPGVAA